MLSWCRLPPLWQVQPQSYPLGSWALRGRVNRVHSGALGEQGSRAWGRGCVASQAWLDRLRVPVPNPGLYRPWGPQGSTFTLSLSTGHNPALFWPWCCHACLQGDSEGQGQSQGWAARDKQAETPRCGVCRPALWRPGLGHSEWVCLDVGASQRAALTPGTLPVSRTVRAFAVARDATTQMGPGPCCARPVLGGGHLMHRPTPAPSGHERCERGAICPHTPPALPSWAQARPGATAVCSPTGQGAQDPGHRGAVLRAPKEAPLYSLRSLLAQPLLSAPGLAPVTC